MPSSPSGCVTSFILFIFFQVLLNLTAVFTESAHICPEMFGKSGISTKLQYRPSSVASGERIGNCFG